MTPRRTSIEADETRSLLLRAARERFGGVGFAKTKASEIAEMAGVTRGALLHHFVDKSGIFAAVLEEVEQDVATMVITRALEGADPLDQLRRGFEAFLDECLDPSITQIMLIDGPSVLGWEAWHEIDSRYGYAPVVDVVRSCIGAGQIASDDAESLTHLLLGALSEAAIFVGRSDDRHEARRMLGQSLNRLIDGLLSP